ncbi:uncharacterized protein SPPG_07836 [Spizellomyces punctatus DAOM BR117]|uniref:Uncharacterized protein n=1 Tax=Spizellomyces punctatus (strain DAOM BR117) TaxID=645134 RepID=A0A0L0H708_SPIPD|nr:uncharacterized protein SPPG_07836 [Spizellomyces punctatus DAOM BR117]KNC97022.1 hypothetical protein SPPG_07836 [Spizellomyces punctatus DAOM BR117]|eukprot:XP_016605062.1 hypothetical protein SPPG_07836 [Spizellomyces punctatus DAOM BR117]
MLQPTVKELNTTDGSNRFRFQSFHDRIKTVKIDVAHRVRQHGPIEDEDGSFFKDALDRWVEVNCTGHFTSFVRDVRPLSMSLVQILYHKDAMMTLIMRHLQIFDSLAYEPILDLTVALARDLQDDFHPYIRPLFEIIVRLLQISDIKLTECLFNTLAYLVKYQSKYLLNDMSSTFDLMVPLLRSTKEYIRRFAAESFGSLMRKVQGASAALLYEDIIRRLRATPEDPLLDGLSALFFEAVKQVDGNVHYRSPVMVRQLFLVILSEGSDDTDPAYRMLQRLFELVGHHTATENLIPLWDTLLSELQSWMEKIRAGTPTATIYMQLSKIMHLIRNWVALRNGRKVTNRESLYMTLNPLCQLLYEARGDCPSHTKTAFVELLAECLLISSMEEVLTRGKDILNTLFTTDDFALVLHFCDLLHHRNWEHFPRIILPYLLTYIQGRWALHPKEFILCLASFCGKIDQYIATLPYSFKTADNRIRFDSHVSYLRSSTRNEIKSKPESDIAPAIIDLLRERESWNAKFREIANESHQASSDLGLLAAVCSTIPYIALPFADVFEALNALIASLVDVLSGDMLTDPASRAVMSALAGHVIGALSESASRSGSIHRLGDAWDVIITSFLPYAVNNAVALQGVADFVEVLQRSGDHALLSTGNLGEVFATIGKDIGSLNGDVRLHTLRILCAFDQCPLEPSKDSAYTGTCPVFAICLEVERTANTVATLREKTILFRRLESLALSGTLPAMYAQAPLRYALAMLSVPFTPLWAEATKLVCNLGQRDLSLFWSAYYETLLGADVTCMIRKDMNMCDQAGLENKEDVSPALEAPQPGVTVNCTNVADGTILVRAVYTDIDDRLSIFLRDLVTISSHRFDPVKYHSLLIGILSGVPQAVEKHSEQIVSIFLALFEMEDCRQTTFQPRQPLPNGAGTERQQAHVEIRDGCRMRVIDFLGVMSKVRQPSRIYKSHLLYNVYLQLLSHGDDRLQRLALECIIAWKQPGILYLEDALKCLTEDDKFRDTLSKVDMEDIHANVKVVDQAPLAQVLVRILYGKLISKRGRSSAMMLRARRTAIFAFLAGLDESYRAHIFDMMLDSFDAVVCTPEPTFEAPLQITDGLMNESLRDMKRKIGYLHLLQDAIKQLRNLLVPFLPKLLKVLLYLLHFSNTLEEDRKRNNRSSETNEDPGESYVDKQLKEIRVLAIRRVNELFEVDLDFDFSPYIPAMFQTSINKRIAAFGVENTQAPSSLLELLRTWSKHRQYASYLIDYSPLLFPSILSLLSAKKVQPAVVNVVLEIVEAILLLDDEYPSDSLATNIIKPSLSVLMFNLRCLLSSLFEDKGPTRLLGNTIPARVIRILAQISMHVTDADQASNLLDMMLPYLKRPAKAVPESTKVEILRIFSDFVSILPALRETSPCGTIYFKVISQLFGTLESREAREQLLKVFSEFVKLDASLNLVSELIHGLNAYSTNRLDEPDFDRRFEAFGRISQSLYVTLSCTQWLPILHNLLFYIQEPEEFSIRTSAGFCVSQFIARTSEQRHRDTPEECAERMNLLVHVILPRIRRGFKLKIELIRQEFLNLLAQTVRSFPSLSSVSDMVGLLADGDEEASFFGNIYHMQIHRRIRALRRLADECRAGHLTVGNIANVFVPIVVHFIFESDRVQDHDLINEAVTTLAACAGSLSWGHYYGLLKRFLNALQHKPALEKVINRVIISVLDNFHFDVSGKNDHAMPNVSSEESAVQLYVPEDANDHVEVDIDEDQIDEGAEGMVNKLGSEMPDISLTERVHSTVMQRLLPDLQGYLAAVDDNTIPIRVPLALAIAKLLQKLPEKSIQVQLPKLITTLCQFLRSRGQDARDRTRDTLVKIAAVLGAEYLPFILKELEGALTRGYQLHVLGFTVHSLVSNMVPTVAAGQLDACVGNLVRICMADIFGDVGAEREVEELRGKMREIKVTKSFDSFELISQVVSFNMIGALLLPLKELMLETNSAPVIRKLEEVLRKLAVGLSSNTGLSETDLMVFIHNLVTESLSISQMPAQTKRERAVVEQNFLVQLKRTDCVEPLKYFQANAHMFVNFGLSLLLTALRTERVSIRNERHLSMLDPLLELLGRSLYSKHSAVSIQALRILTILAKAPLPKLKETIPIVLKRLFEIVSRSLATNPELVQAAFRLLTTIIRDCSYVPIDQNQIAALLDVIRPDVETQVPDRQTTVFSLIRAILGRKFLVKEIYDLMDIVRKCMVTSQSAQVRDLCRQTYLQFLLNYPHGPNSLRKQLGYLVKNLAYEHESGRESVLEILNLLIHKGADEMIFHYAEMLFVALVMNLVNDDSAKCREISGSLLSTLTARLDGNRVSKLQLLVEKWFEQDTQPHLQRTAAQVAGLMVEASGEKQKRWPPALLAHLEKVLHEVAEQQGRTNEQEETGPIEEGHTWQIAYYTVNTFSKVLVQYPDTMDATEPIWQHVHRLLLHPHQWVRIACSRSFGLLFGKIDVISRKVINSRVASPHTVLASQESLKHLGNSFCAQLNSDLLTTDLATQVVKNLFFLGKCFYELNKGNFAMRGLVPSLEELDDTASHESEPILEDQIPSSGPDDAPSHGDLLLALCRKLSYLARAEASKKRGPILRRSVFQWFAAMSRYIPSVHLKLYLVPMVSTLYRTSKDETAKGSDADELRLLANEVMELIQRQVGTADYLEVYNQVHFRVQTVRQERRVQRNVQAVLDPEARARRKLQKSNMKRTNRKRKAEEFARTKHRTNISKKLRHGQ